MFFYIISLIDEAESVLQDLDSAHIVKLKTSTHLVELFTVDNIQQNSSPSGTRFTTQHPSAIAVLSETFCFLRALTSSEKRGDVSARKIRLFKNVPGIKII